MIFNRNSRATAAELRQARAARDHAHTRLANIRAAVAGVVDQLQHIGAQGNGDYAARLITDQVGPYLTPTPEERIAAALHAEAAVLAPLDDAEATQP